MPRQYRPISFEAAGINPDDVAPAVHLLVASDIGHIVVPAMNADEFFRRHSEDSWDYLGLPTSLELKDLMGSPVPYEWLPRKHEQTNT